MVDIKFSRLATGACPTCKCVFGCHILDFIEEELQKVVSSVKDKSMEMVIYKCPEFEQEEYNQPKNG